MKLKLRMVALASALASLAGFAHADITTTATNNGTLNLLAFNPVTNDYYMRDLGTTINGFLPVGAVLKSADAAAGPQTFVTPAAGLTIDKTVNPNFGDASFATWLSNEVVSDVRWIITAVDTLGGGLQTATNDKRMITTSAVPNQLITNAVITQATNTSYFAGYGSIFNPGGLSITGNNVNFILTLADPSQMGAAAYGTVGQAVNLFYAAYNGTGGSGSTLAIKTKYGNAAGDATISLAANGDVVYNVPAPQVAAVPLPAAGWLLGAGVMALGGAIRRRRGMAVDA